jgi:hypothetical protein
VTIFGRPTSNPVDGAWLPNKQFDRRWRSGYHVHHVEADVAALLQQGRKVSVGQLRCR